MTLRLFIFNKLFPGNVVVLIVEPAYRCQRAVSDVTLVYEVDQQPRARLSIVGRLLGMVFEDAPVNASSLWSAALTFSFWVALVSLSRRFYSPYTVRSEKAR